MPEINQSTASTKSNQRRTLEKARLDWTSIKTQMSAAAFLIIGSSLISFLPTIKLGFMGADFNLIGRLAAFSGQTWTEKPLGNLSLWLNFLISHTHAGAYHALNIVLYAASALMTGLITLELSGRLGNRQGGMAALWAGLLFSVYPLAAGPVASISCRGDLLGLLFYLATIWCYQRYCLLKEKNYFSFSLLAALLTALSNPCALSLPLAVSALSLLYKENPLPYFIASAIALLFPLDQDFAWHCTVGNSLGKLFVANNEAVLSSHAFFPTLLSLILYAALLIIFLARFCLTENNRSKSQDITVPVLLWFAAAATVAGGKQVGNVLENAQYFLPAAAPLSILLSFALLGRSDLKAGKEKPLLALSLLTLSLLYGTWSVVLAANLKPWQQAAASVSLMRRKIEQAASCGAVILLNLPVQKSGVPYFLDGEQLTAMLRPPYTGKDLGKEVEVGSAGSLSADKQILACVDEEMVFLDPPAAASDTKSDALRCDLRNCQNSREAIKTLASANALELEDAQSWHKTSASNKLELTDSFSRFTNAGNKPLTIWLPWQISSSQAMLPVNRWYLHIDDGGHANPPFEIVCRTSQKESEQSIQGANLVDLSEMSDYILGYQPRQLGLRIPPQSNLTIAGLELNGSKEMK